MKNEPFDAPLLDTAVFDGFRKAKGDFSTAEHLTGFPEMSRYRLVAASRAAEAAEWQAVGQSALDIKTSAAELGLLRLANAAAEIETTCADGRIEDAQRLLVGLQVYLLAAMDAIRAHVKELGL